MPFVPGKSGNPGGRPKEEREVLALARAKSLEAIERLAQWISSDNPKASIQACNSILDRAFGKPTQPISGDADGAPIAVDDLSGIPRELRLKLQAKMLEALRD